MSGLHWPPYVFAGVMVLVSVYCSLRLLASWRWRRRIHVDINVAHVTMGVAMAGTLVPALRTLPTGLWETVFAGLAAWFSLRGARFVTRHRGDGPGGDLHYVSHYLTHLVMAGAMLYMFMATPTATGALPVSMSMGGASAPTADFVALPLFFVAVLCVSAVWHVDHLSQEPTRRPVLVGAGAPAPSTAVSAGHGIAGGDADAFLAPRLEGLCHIAMCITMGYMLVLML